MRNQLVIISKNVADITTNLSTDIHRFCDRANSAVPYRTKEIDLQINTGEALVFFQAGGMGRPDGGIIRVSAHESAGILTISVHNDGPALSAVRAGVGLSNTEGRLATLYGDSGSVELRNHLEAGVETLIRVPWRIDS